MDTKKKKKKKKKQKTYIYIDGFRFEEKPPPLQSTFIHYYRSTTNIRDCHQNTATPNIYIYIYMYNIHIDCIINETTLLLLPCAPSNMLEKRHLLLPLPRMVTRNIDRVFVCSVCRRAPLNTCWEMESASASDGFRRNIDRLFVCLFVRCRRAPSNMLGRNPWDTCPGICCLCLCLGWF
jgi:hypothetical protein